MKNLPLGHDSGTTTIPYSFPLPPGGTDSGVRLSPLVFMPTSILWLEWKKRNIKTFTFYSILWIVCVRERIFYSLTFSSRSSSNDFEKLPSQTDK